MLESSVIGRLGADAVQKVENGREFLVFRVANQEKWSAADGTVHEQITWIDCIMNGRPAVAQFLKKGQLVYATGRLKLRTYSSKKDRCIKAGATIQVNNVELLGGPADAIPGRLYDANSGEQVVVEKSYICKALKRTARQAEWWPLVSEHGSKFVVDRNGQVFVYEEPATDASAE